MAKHWMQKAFGKNPGGEHRALGVPEGQPIPAKKHAQAARGMFGKRVKKMEQASKNANQ
ncbi:MAG: hypothetical protein WB608_01400 [Terracidiphilus sp.]